MDGCVEEYLTAMTRRKAVDKDTVGDSKLARVLTVFDLSALGVGATLGAGVYVLTGSVAKEISGPSVVFSFLIAALTSVLSGLCYAEFGARVPKAGSGYVYSYVTVGECCAFVIGWNLILSYVIGAASVARAWTANFDALISNRIDLYMKECCSFNISGLAPYPDFFSFLVIIILTALIAFGVKEFATVNKIFTVLNIGVIIFVIIAGLTKADLHNWGWTPEEIADHFKNATTTIASNTSMMMTYGVENVTMSMVSTGFENVTMSMVPTGFENVTMSMVPTGFENITLSTVTATLSTPTNFGLGGFLPYGFSGLISGTATCFYAFVGFDCIATTGEEAINPQRSIPLGIVFSLIVCCIAYLGISATLTLMQPYFLLNKDAPLPFAFEYVGMSLAKYPVSIGAICALSTSLLGAMFPMPRIIYAMAIDGLLFKFLAKVHDYTKTPLIATIVSGLFAGVMAVLFDLKELVDLMSIGTLAAYTLVAASVLLLRYQPDPEADVIVPSDDDVTTEKEKASLASSSFRMSMLLWPPNHLPTHLSSQIVNWATVTVSLGIVLFSVIAVVGIWHPVLITLAVILLAMVIIGTVVIFLQPQSIKELSFSVPFVPFVPILNMFVNIFLMISLPPSTWYKMVVWMVLGGLIYFMYGVGHSAEGKRSDMRVMEMKPVVSNEQDEKLLDETDLRV